MIAYTVFGLYPILKKEMDNQFKRLGFKGFKDLKEKRWFLNKVLGCSPFFSEMTINELKTVISELKKYNAISEIK
ncbi:hypothetical protein [Bacillus pumilus]|uniref:hypothetical protein n=1 Tax=Bacillus pumilus TaxID=1408 RepID=UPI002280D526|nr:hypothetical protein [Bacillus pumilus]MCY7500226.1 hypothetical protein [Bacillus pumilus]MCY7528450.1 hypothetical protein [Bacillus pumilus]MED4490035.1 hypothetical protein [Bacillus pumilus]